MPVLPMFPLGSVLFPGAVLPLHVFEPRYRQLVTDCINGEAEFGTVLISRGSEVGGGDVRTNLGTRAQMVQVVRLEAGRFGVMCIGTTRLRVQRWLDDDPYPRAEVLDWPDVEEHLEPNRWWSSDGSALVELDHLVAWVRRLAALAVELGDSVPEASKVLPSGAVALSYELSALAPIGLLDRQELLGKPGPVSRLDDLAGRLEDVEALLQFRLGEV